MTLPHERRNDFEQRNITIAGRRTKIALEPAYWRLIEITAAQTRQEWPGLVETLLRAKPPSFSSRAGWLRLLSLKLILRGINDELHRQVFPHKRPYE
jgi:predicted DNA-binding ribbon-helix-helix protein